MKFPNIYKSILLVVFLSLALVISSGESYAGPLIIITKAECKGNTMRPGAKTKYFLTLNNTTAAFYFSINNPPSKLYLYYRDVTGNPPTWQLNGIPPSNTANGGYDYMIPTVVGHVYEIMLATGNTSASLGSTGSGANQTFIKITGCNDNTTTPPKDKGPIGKQ